MNRTKEAMTFSINLPPQLGIETPGQRRAQRITFLQSELRRLDKVNLDRVITTLLPSVKKYRHEVIEELDNLKRTTL